MITERTIKIRGSITDFATDIAYEITMPMCYELIAELERFCHSEKNKFQNASYPEINSINPEVKSDFVEGCIVAKITGTGDRIECKFLKHHSGLHSYQLPRDSYGENKINPEIKPDPVNPSHYNGDSVMRFIEEFKLGFCLGNTVKYIARHEHKDKLQDLKKALWYLNQEIEKMENAK